MGTTVSIDVREPFVAAAALDEVIAWFHDVDRRFSPFRPDSEVTRVGTGELAFEDASADVRAIFTLADRVCDRTDGYFDPAAHRPDGRRDPTGVTKGWAVDEALAMLRLAGARNVQVNAGGDLFAAGGPAPGRPWRIGIRHPGIGDRVAAVLEVSDMAVATSGQYERGGHIRDPRSGTAADGLRSLTVVGATVAMADGFATAGFAMGEAGVAWVALQPGYGAIAITADERVIWTELAHTLRADVPA
jgi:thiamine biosynthesis lipoprotein